MGIYVNDGHGLWTLQAFSDFNIDGTLKRGFYFKKTAEQSEGMNAILTGSNLLLLEHAEQITRARLNDPTTRQDVLDKLHNPLYRGALIYAAVDDTKVNFGELYTRMNNAKAEWEATAKEAGLPVQEYHPGPIIQPSEGDNPPEVIDDRPEWQRLDFDTKAEWKAWVAAGRPERN